MPKARARWVSAPRGLPPGMCTAKGTRPFCPDAEPIQRLRRGSQTDRSYMLDRRSYDVGIYARIGCGRLLCIQQAVNANLRGEIGSPWWAGFVSYVGGTLAMLSMAVVLRERVPSPDMLGRSAWLSWSGGLFGAAYIAISIIMLPQLGSATVIALIVAGQMLGSLAFDHFGFSECRSIS